MSDTAIPVTAPLPPATAIVHKLDSIEAVLGILVRGQEKAEQADQALQAQSDTIVQAFEVIERQSQDTSAQLAALVQHVTRVEAQQRGLWPAWPWWVTTGALLMALTGTVWWCWPQTRWNSLALTVDAALVERWGTLAKPVQEQLTGIYVQQGVPPPNQRQKGQR
jgi:hypothetical protein